MIDKQEYIRVLKGIRERSLNNHVCDPDLYEATIDEAIKAISKPDKSEQYIKDLDNIRTLINRFDAMTLPERKENGETETENVPPENITSKIFYIYTILSLRYIGEMSETYDSIDDPFEDTLEIIKRSLQLLCLYIMGERMCTFCDMKDKCWAHKAALEMNK